MKKSTKGMRPLTFPPNKVFFPVVSHLRVVGAHDNPILEEPMEAAILEPVPASRGTDPRLAQATRLWRYHFDRDPTVRAQGFTGYLKGTPQIPESLIAEDSNLPFLALADPRPGISQICRLLGIYPTPKFANHDLVPFDRHLELPTGPFWFRHDGGCQNVGRCPDECRDDHEPGILIGTAMVGLFAIAHDQHLLEEGMGIDLPGSKRLGIPSHCACVMVVEGVVRMGTQREVGVALPYWGTLRFRLQ